MKFRSIVSTQQQGLFALLKLHNKGNPIEIDPMYNRGEIYNLNGHLQHPNFRLDLNPEMKNCAPGDARDLEFPDSHFESMLLDPPWLLGKSRNKMTDRFSQVETREALQQLIYEIILESYRVLKSNGLLIFKCQDCIDNRRKWFMHFYVIKCALHVGFNPLDMIVVNAPSRMRSQKKGMEQKATQSQHSYLIAFRKKLSRVAYKFPTLTKAESELSAMEMVGKIVERVKKSHGHS